MLQRLFTPCARSSNPHPSTVRRPSSLASPATAIASFTGMQVKICFFLFFSFHSFSDQYSRDSLSHVPGPQTPASPPHNPHPRAFPSSLTSPAAAIACIRRHTSKDKFFSSFFRFFSDQCYRDPLYPTCQVLKPLPLHHIISTPMPRPSSLASPRHHLCLTACKPVASSTFATCKSAATTTPSLHARSAHDADSPQASPAMTPSQHSMQGLPCCQPTTCKPHRGTTSTWNARPQHCQPAVHKPCHGTTLTWNARSHHC